MLRVLETISRSSQAEKFVAERADLTAWINEILTHLWAFQVRICSATLSTVQIILTSVSVAHERDALQLHRPGHLVRRHLLDGAPRRGHDALRSAHRGLRAPPKRLQRAEAHQGERGRRRLAARHRRPLDVQHAV